MKRKAISYKVLYAALLVQHFKIPHEDAKQMTVDQVISLFQPDHYPILHSDGGPDEPWNLTLRYISEHREKTKADVKALAKSKRIRAWNEKRSRKRPATQKRKIPSRPFPKRLQLP